MSLKILNDFYEYQKWLVDKISKFPRNQRYVLGSKIENHAYTILEKLITAQYQKNKLSLLHQINIDLEILRYYIRFCNDLNLLTIRSYEYSSKQLQGIGSQLGGWIKEQTKDA
ncbi:MAG: diversity-generating retroelement protein Avd [Candidatus Cloacimonetes bacterium]|nr:diversity-generating retroelement protein Avd [Candidatus Cloacimonadota bacterium]